MERRRLDVLVSQYLHDRVQLRASVGELSTDRMPKPVSRDGGFAIRCEESCCCTDLLERIIKQVGHREHLPTSHEEIVCENSRLLVTQSSCASLQPLHLPNGFCGLFGTSDQPFRLV